MRDDLRGTLKSLGQLVWTCHTAIFEILRDICALTDLGKDHVRQLRSYIVHSAHETIKG